MISRRQDCQLHQFERRTDPGRTGRDGLRRAAKNVQQKLEEAYFQPVAAFARVEPTAVAPRRKPKLSTTSPPLTPRPNRPRKTPIQWTRAPIPRLLERPARMPQTRSLKCPPTLSRAPRTMKAETAGLWTSSETRLTMSRPMISARRGSVMIWLRRMGFMGI